MDPRNKRLIAIYAHPDDAEIWSGGTIAKWVQNGGKAKIVCFSKEIIRTEEAVAGAKILGSDIIVLKKAHTISSINIESVSKLIEKFNPHIVITHYYADSHPRHRNVFEIVSNAIIHNRIKNGNPELFLCANTYNEIGINGTFNPNVYIDISDYLDVKLTAIEQHKSQPYDMWKNMVVTQDTALGARLSKIKYAEGFIQIPILGKLAALSLF